MKDFKCGEGPHGQGDVIFGGVAMSVLKKYALIAACTTAVAAFAQTAQAATWTIVGGVPFAFAGYGTAPANNNVVNNPPSMVVDASGGANFLAQGRLDATFATTSYGVQWFYFGSESDRVDTFQSPLGVAAPFAEDNRNNNCIGCTFPSAPRAVVLMGSATLQTALTPGFTFAGAGTVSNGANNPANSGIANFVLSYASLVGTNLVMQAAPSDWVIIGFNDNAFADDNHDDFMVAARIFETGNVPGDTPIPGALPLFASALGGGFLLLRNRRRKQA